MTPRVDGVISHWDIDGIASAAILAHYMGVPIENIRLSSTGRIHVFFKELLNAGVNRIYILDLNPNFTVASRIASESSVKHEVIWIDHHRWHDEALDVVRGCRNHRLIVDPESPCTAIMIATELLRDVELKDPHKLMLRLAIDDDTFNDKLELTRRWRMLLRWGDWSLRYKILEDWIDGIIWPSWAEREYERVRGDYERLLAKALGTIEIANASGFKILFAYPDEKIHPGDLQRAIENIAKERADVYVFIYERGVSLRSNILDVSRIAKMLGGGGHRNAAGAKMNTDRENVKNIIINLIWKLSKKIQ